MTRTAASADGRSIGCCGGIGAVSCGPRRSRARRAIGSSPTCRRRTGSHPGTSSRPTDGGTRAARRPGRWLGSCRPGPPSLSWPIRSLAPPTASTGGWRGTGTRSAGGSGKRRAPSIRAGDRGELRRAERRAVQHQRERTVVEELHLHRRTEHTASHAHLAGLQRRGERFDPLRRDRRILRLPP